MYTSVSLLPFWMCLPPMPGAGTMGTERHRGKRTGRDALQQIESAALSGTEQGLIARIVSGGQTGVDRAALDWARRRGVDHGGWCPKGRLAADGPLADDYHLKETESAGYRQRTKLNVRDSDATLVFNTGVLDGGTLQTVRFCQVLSKPYLVVQLDEEAAERVSPCVRQWLEQGGVSILNVAGPREEKRPGIYSRVGAVLDGCFAPRCASGVVLDAT